MHALAPCPSVMHALRAYASYPLLIRACAPTRLSCLHAFALTNKRLTGPFFVLCCVFSVKRHGFRLKNSEKATDPDFIPLKIIKFASDVINSHLYNIIIKDLEKSKYSEDPKTALVRPIFKKNERNKTGNHRPVSILNGMPKIYERCIHNSLFLMLKLNFISAYKKSYS